MKKTTCIILSFAFLLIACIEQIEFRPDEEIKIVIIDGLLTDQDTLQKVSIQYSATIGSVAFSPYSDALVYITDNAGNRNLLDEIEPGIYAFEGKAEVGIEYFLEVYRGNVLIASSSMEATPPPFALDSISFEEKLLSYTNVDGNPRNLWSVEFYGHASTAKADTDFYLRFGDLETIFMLPEIITKTFPPPITCYIYNYENKPIIDPIKIEKGAENVNIKTKILSKQTTYDFAYLYSTKATLYSMSRESYEFWNQVSVLFNQTGNITDQLPAQFNGNITAEADIPITGNFSVVSTTSDFVMVRRSDLFRPPIKVCGENGGPYPNPVPDVCNICLIHPNSTAQFPSYW